jgi:hypothetical protein
MLQVLLAVSQFAAIGFVILANVRTTGAVTGSSGRYFWSSMLRVASSLMIFVWMVSAAFSLLTSSLIHAWISSIMACFWIIIEHRREKDGDLFTGLWRRLLGAARRFCEIPPISSGSSSSPKT